MGYASRCGRSTTSAKKPLATAVCDRCGIWYDLVALRWQVDWRGATLQNLRLLVCDECFDRPQEQLRAIVLPPDPEPMMNARVEHFDAAETDYRTVSVPPTIDPETGIPIPGTTLRTTEDGQNRVIEQMGYPPGLTQNAIMPYNGAVQQAFGVELAVLSVIGDGSATVTVTCSAVHGLQVDSQVAVEGLSWVGACGFFSVVPTTATAFTYQTYGSNPVGSFQTGTTLITTALVGLP